MLKETRVRSHSCPPHRARPTGGDAAERSCVHGQIRIVRRSCRRKTYPWIHVCRIENEKTSAGSKSTSNCSIRMLHGKQPPLLSQQ